MEIVEMAFGEVKTMSAEEILTNVVYRLTSNGESFDLGLMHFFNSKTPSIGINTLITTADNLRVDDPKAVFTAKFGKNALVKFSAETLTVSLMFNGDPQKSKWYYTGLNSWLECAAVVGTT